MRKVLLIVTAMAVFSSGFASTTPAAGKDPVFHADKMFFPVGKTGKVISLLDLSRIRVKEFQELTGRKMSFFDKISFKVAQKKLRDNINRDGTITNKKALKVLNPKAKSGETGFHFGGFALGFFVGLIGVLIAYLINDDYKRNRVKWAWIGLGISVVLSIILFVAVLNSID